MEKHVQVLGILYIVFGVMGLIGALTVFVILGIGGLFSPDEDAALLAVGVGGFIAFIILITSIPCIVAGWGLMKHQNWARILTLVLSFLNLLSFPFGTALGIYGIWLLFKDETVRLFGGQPAPPPASYSKPSGEMR